MSQPFYRAFEDRYRGARSIIKARLNVYLDFLAPLKTLPQPALALDLGCGRGEWLELLAEQGIDACGIDLDMGMLEGCLELGLRAKQADALGSMRSQADSSLALVSAFHLVEHLPFEHVQEILVEAGRVLMPGGLLILETPNPENLSVGATSFYLDPSHERPLPPALLDFAVEFAGFNRHKIVRLQEEPRLHTNVAVDLLDVLQGVSPDYAIVAQKDASPGILKRFDAAFDASYGTTLEVLARRYEHEQQHQFSDIGHALERLTSAHQELQATTESRHEQINGRLQQLEQRGAQLEQRIIDILQSRSWRITAPLRWCTNLMRKLRQARREKRLLSALRWRAGNVVMLVVHAIMRHRWLKRCILQVLERRPGLRAKLKYYIFNTSIAPAPMSHSGSELSPREQEVYQQLQWALDAKKTDAHSY